MRKVLAILLPFLLFLTACSGGDGGDSGPLSSVTIEQGDEGTAPAVDFDEPLSADEPTLTRVNEGDGKEVAAGQTAMLRLAIVNPEDGTIVDESYSAPEAQGIAVDEALKSSNTQLYDALLGARVGSDFAYYVPGNEEAGMETNFLVFTVMDAVDTVSSLTQDEAAARNAEGTLLMGSEEVAALEAEGKLPEVTFDDGGTPSITVPEGAEEPDRLIVKVLEEGDGPVLESTGTVKAAYLGVSLRTGETFDSSYATGEPVEFPLANVVSGWTYGLAGQKAGSKVLLVLPSELAYGDPAQSGPSGPLVFVVDIQEVK